MKIIEWLDELITQRKAIRRLRKELRANVVDKFGFLVAVEERSEVKEWGEPVLRQNGKDWYPIKEVREIDNNRHKKTVNSDQ